MKKKPVASPEPAGPTAVPDKPATSKKKSRQSAPPPVLGLVGARIRGIRIARGIGQDHLAYSSQIDRAHIGQLENGRRAATIPTLARLAMALGCQVGDFFPDVQELAELLGAEQIKPKERGADS
jgi:DNA-binding XRE family transcriptional regulator